MSEKPLPARRARWWQKIICLTQGHNLVGVELPAGWSWQICRMCGQPLHHFRRPDPQP